MADNDAREIFRKNIERLLIREDYSMRRLSEDIGMSSSYIQKVLSGETFPSQDVIEAICDRYDIECWQLFFDYSDDAALKKTWSCTNNESTAWRYCISNRTFRKLSGQNNTGAT